MACTCTEDKEVLPGGVIIGRNRVTCQECLDAQAAHKIVEDNQKIDAALWELDKKRIRALSDDALGVAKVTIGGVEMSPKQYLQSLEDEATAERAKKK